jgi:hypothetical protein
LQHHFFFFKKIKTAHRMALATFAHELHTELHIQASPAEVWAVLTDFVHYPDWNPFVRSLTGEVSVGQRVTIQVGPPDGQVMTFRPRIRAFEKNKELRWLGSLWFRGLFDGEHCFELIGQSDGSTTLRHGEKFGGVLVPLMKKQLDTDTRKGFEALNQRIKERAERT